MDEAGHLSLEREAADTFFELVSSSYEHPSVTLACNLPLSGWGAVFGDQAVAVAMIHWIVHHAEVVAFASRS